MRSLIEEISDDHRNLCIVHIRLAEMPYSSLGLLCTAILVGSPWPVECFLTICFTGYNLSCSTLVLDDRFDIDI